MNLLKSVNTPLIIATFHFELYMCTTTSTDLLSYNLFLSSQYLCPGHSTVSGNVVGSKVWRLAVCPKRMLFSVGVMKSN